MILKYRTLKKIGKKCLQKQLNCVNFVAPKFEMFEICWLFKTAQGLPQNFPANMRSFRLSLTFFASELRRFLTEVLLGQMWEVPWCHDTQTQQNRIQSKTNRAWV